MIKRLSGPRTHICWTPDYEPENKRTLVSLVSEKDLAALEAEIEKLREENRWIPVSERLPKRRIKVLTVNCEYKLGESEPAVGWVGEQSEWYTYGNSSGYCKVTHWKPIILPDQALKG